MKEKLPLSDEELDRQIAHDYYWHKHSAAKIKVAQTALYGSNLRAAEARVVYLHDENSDEQRLTAAGAVINNEHQILEKIYLLDKAHRFYAKVLVLAINNYGADTSRYVDQALKDAREAGYAINTKGKVPVLGVATKEEMKVFAQDRGLGEHGEMGTRVFHALWRGSKDSVAKPEMRMDEKFSKLMIDGDINLDVLESLLEEEKLLTVSNFGPGSVQFVDDFIQHRKDQLPESAQPAEI